MMDQKIKSAIELGLDVEETFDNIDGNFCYLVHIKKDDAILETYSMQVNKDELLAKFENELQSLNDRVTIVQNYITEINEVE